MLYPIGWLFRHIILVRAFRSIIDVIVEENLMSKPYNEAYKLVKEMATNNFQLPFDLVNPKRVVRFYESDILSTLSTMVAIISERLDTIGVGSRS